MEITRNDYHHGIFHYPVFKAITSRFQDTKSKLKEKKHHIQREIIKSEIRAHKLIDNTHHRQIIFRYKIQGYRYGAERLRSEQNGSAF